jgi:phosphoglycerate kinase
MKSITEATILPGTKVFVRVDFNVPIEKGVIKEAYRLEASLPTLKYIVEKKGIPVIAGHIGEPHGITSDELSTKQLASYYDAHLGKGTYELLENLRFSLGEEQNSESYARDLAEGCQIYVNEGFSVSHRKHASIVGMPLFLPSFAGFRLQQEIENLTKLITAPQHPFTAVIGGAKLESKKPTVNKFLDVADNVLLGGKLGTDWKEEVPQKLHLPEDSVEDNMDIGSKTINAYSAIIAQSKTILWAGPVGVYEKDEYFTGTKQLAISIANQTKAGAFTVIGGGDTIAAIDKAGLLDQYSFVSTGGGAMLEFLVEGTLPGIEALN